MPLFRRSSSTKSSDAPSDGPGTAKSISPTKDAGKEVVNTKVGFSDPDEAAAAAKIQAIKRGQQSRAKVSEEKQLSKMREDREKAAVKLQAITKGRAARASTEKVKTETTAKANPCTGMMEEISALMGKMKCDKCFAPKAKSPEPSAETKLSPQLLTKVRELFNKMDTDGDGMVVEAEAVNFFKSFAKLNARAMLNEVDTDRNGSATYEEMCDFWANVMSTGNYGEEELLEELDNILKGEGWTDFDDGRTT